MKFSEYIAGHQVFTTSGLLRACSSAGSAEEQLRLAVKSGAVERVRRGLYVSGYGRFEDVAINPLAVVMVADADAVVSFHSACEAHGIAHNVGFTCQFRSNSVRKPFVFRNVEYTPCGPVGDALSRMVRSGDIRVRVTTREQTIVDCLGKPKLAGGIEEAIRSVSAFAYVDVDALTGIVRTKGAQEASRMGWLLREKQADWHVGEAVLEELRGVLGPGPYRLGRPDPSRKGWSREWRLILPDTDEEVASWVTRG